MEMINTDVECTVRISPGDDMPTFITESINQAKHKIWLMHSEIYDKRIADALLFAAKKGLDVKVLTGKGDEGLFNLLQAGKVEVRSFQPNSYQGREMHQKVALIDGEIILCGSVNYFDRSLEKDLENLLMIKDDLACSLFEAEFSKLWALSEVRKYSIKRKKPKIKISKVKHLKKLFLDLLLITSLIINFILLLNTII